MPSVSAVVRMRARSTRLGARTGSSAGMAPSSRRLARAAASLAVLGLGPATCRTGPDRLLLPRRHGLRPHPYRPDQRHERGGRIDGEPECVDRRLGRRRLGRGGNGARQEGRLVRPRRQGERHRHEDGCLAGTRHRPRRVQGTRLGRGMQEADPQGQRRPARQEPPGDGERHAARQLAGEAGRRPLVVAGRRIDQGQCEAAREIGEEMRGRGPAQGPLPRWPPPVRCSRRDRAVGRPESRSAEHRPTGRAPARSWRAGFGRETPPAPPRSRQDLGGHESARLSRGPPEGCFGPRARLVRI
jgi:hypothetical protein